ncbi:MULTISPECIES: low molecular weight protein-tyrosine-phosphatase [Flavobacterium]|uniref:low molecular weight protein-tyrosine-phosphatase n=1 Tax=Flavobacterium TaxID=237 RepID=UPI001FCBC7EE|nr:MULTISPECIES: low molecular weight protein-tyrosine-phosphatase [Flavobacterium]UOK42544.1 low molecular weight phosphotyrosine protein phosphatase [Flavobacterium enshiense]
MPVKILMVCLGNICRSPLAEGILQSKLPKEQFLVDSAGTGSWHVGQEPDKRSVLIAKNKGLDITNQRGRQIKKSDFDNFDYIYVMDISNYKDVMALAPNAEAKSKVTMILNELFPGENADVPDPYHGGQSGFEHVFMLLNEACEIIAEKLKAKH